MRLLVPLLVFGGGLIFNGCASTDACEGSCGDSDATSATDDTDVMNYSSEQPVPGWTADQVGEQISAFMALGEPNPMQLAETFRGILLEGDADCPGDTKTLTTPPEGCETDAGDRYAGIGYYYQSEWLTMEDEGQVPLDWVHGGDFEIQRADGSIVSGGGGLTYEAEVADDGGITFDYDLHGSWVDSDRPDWLGVGLSAVVLAEGGESAGGADPWLTLTGGIGLGDAHFHFETLTWDAGGTCAGAATGKLHVRDARGYWYVWDLGDDCDTCGDVTFHSDQDLGELCLDLTAYGAAMFLENAPRESAFILTP